MDSDLSCNIHSSLGLQPASLPYRVWAWYPPKLCKATPENNSLSAYTCTHAHSACTLPISSVSQRTLINIGSYLYFMDKKEVDENELIDLLPIIYSASPPGKLPPNKFPPQKAMLLQFCPFSYHSLECILPLLWKPNSRPLMFSSSSTSQHGSLTSSPVVQTGLLAIPIEWQSFENCLLSIIKVNSNYLFYCWSPLVTCDFLWISKLFYFPSIFSAYVIVLYVITTHSYECWMKIGLENDYTHYAALCPNYTDGNKTLCHPCF